MIDIRRRLRLPSLGTSWLDLKLGVRMLVRYPVLTVIGTISLALAIAIGAAAVALISLFRVGVKRSKIDGTVSYAAVSEMWRIRARPVRIADVAARAPTSSVSWADPKRGSGPFDSGIQRDRTRTLDLRPRFAEGSDGMTVLGVFLVDHAE